MDRINALRVCMCADQISSQEKVAQLSEELASMHGVSAFRECQSMGAITFLNISVTLEVDF
jgi:hypothetical protein